MTKYIQNEYVNKQDDINLTGEISVINKLALLYNFASVYTNIPSRRRDGSKTSSPLQEGIFVYSRVFVQ